jgi:hypothetical protein
VCGKFSGMRPVDRREPLAGTKARRFVLSFVVAFGLIGSLQALGQAGVGSQSWTFDPVLPQDPNAPPGYQNLGNNRVDKCLAYYGRNPWDVLANMATATGCAKRLCQALNMGFQGGQFTETTPPPVKCSGWNKPNSTCQGGTVSVSCF